MPNAPLYTVPVYDISPEVYLWTLVASPFVGLWSVAFVRAIAWADRARPSDWRRFVAPPLVFLGVGLLSIVFPELLGNGQDVAQLLFLHPLAPFALALLLALRPLATVASVGERRARRPFHALARGGRARRRGAWRAVALGSSRG